MARGGAMRRVSSAGSPGRWKFDVFVSYGFANPWGHYIDRWGQNFVADASGGANYYGTAFSGQVVYPQKHGGMKQFFPMQWRPTCGCELVYSRHFPDDTQGDYLLNNNIGFQGILRYRVKEDGSGFAGTPVEPLLRSSDPNFRPVALQFGPDGALYVVDWFNPLVGHMQHSLRDPNRDHTHGRIWRITYPKRPLRRASRGSPVPRCPSCSTCSSRTKTGPAIGPAASCASGPSRRFSRPWRSGSSSLEQERPRILAANARGALAAPEPRQCGHAASQADAHLPRAPCPRRRHPRALLLARPRQRPARTVAQAGQRRASPRAARSDPRAELLRGRPGRQGAGDRAGIAPAIPRTTTSNTPQRDHQDARPATQGPGQAAGMISVQNLDSERRVLSPWRWDGRDCFRKSRFSLPRRELRSRYPRRRLALAPPSQVTVACLTLALSAPSLGDRPLPRQPAREAAQERAGTRGPPGRDRRDDRQARHGGRPRVTSIEQTLRRRLPDSTRSALKALEALAEAAANRKLKPAQDLEKMSLRGCCASRIRRPRHDRAGTGRAGGPAGGPLEARGGGGAARGIAHSPAADDALRGEALDALAAIGGRAGRAQIEALAGRGPAAAIRVLAVASLAKLDVDAAAARAAGILPRRAAPGRDLTPLLAAFLNRQGGADILAAALDRHAIPPDAAKLALRAVYALGHADPALVATLSRAAGLSAEIKPLTPAELSSSSPRSPPNGDPRRGETIFRRADLNCMSCHSLSKAGGDVGPDLSAIGQTSPADYIINSILNPDQSIKEQYHTLVVLTSDGQVFQGIVTDKDDQRIVLKEATGASRVVPVGSIEDQKPGGSLMPKGLANLMTRAEFVDLVRFLSELGKPGPYAIRTIPTIQRWRVLKPVSEACLVPSLLAKRCATRCWMPTERWTSAYARVDGSLPLERAASPPRAARWFTFRARSMSQTPGRSGST